MARCMFFTRNRFDGATLSGGSWSATLPLTNLQDRKLSKVARTANASLTSTQMVADLTASYYVRAVSLHKTNLSTAANYRIRGYDTAAVTRADTATYVDEDGVVTSVTANILRQWHYLTDNAGTFRRVTLLERAYTNLVTSDNFDAGWASFGTPIVTAGIDDPAAGTGAYRIEDNDPVGVERKSLAVTYTGDGTKSSVFIVREATMASSGYQVLAVYDGTAGAYRVLAYVTAWVSGKPSVTMATGVLLGTFQIGNGYWAIAVQSSSVTAANSHTVLVQPCEQGAATGSIDIYRAMAFDYPVPPASVLSASEATTADDFTVALLDSTPQEATYLYEGVVLDLPNQGNYRWLWNIGSSESTTKHLGAYYNNSSARLYMDFGNGSAQKFGYWNVSLSLGDYIAIRTYQGADGSITAKLTINAAAEVSLDGAVVTQSLPTSWAANAVRFGGTSGVTPHANQGLISFKAQSGAEKTLAEMQALVNADIAYYSPYDSQWTAAYPAIYPSGVLDVGDDGYATQKLTAEDYTAGYRVDPIVTMTGTQKARYWSIEFDDTANADGYVQLGRVWIAYGYQPTQNLSTGSGLGWRDPSIRSESDGTDALYDVRTPRRIYDFAFDSMPEDESLVRLFDGLCRAGITHQMLFVTDPDDTYHMHRRSILAVMQTLSPLQNKAAAFYDQAYSLVEEI